MMGPLVLQTLEAGKGKPAPSNAGSGSERGELIDIFHELVTNGRAAVERGREGSSGVPRG